jgi:hypothetical protein
MSFASLRGKIEAPQMKIMRYTALGFLGLLCLEFAAALFYQPTGHEGFLLHNLALAARARGETAWLLILSAGCLATRLVPRWNTRDSALVVEGCLLSMGLYCLLLYGAGFGATYACIAVNLKLTRPA